jgi:hypothetical protein
MSNSPGAYDVQGGTPRQMTKEEEDVYQDTMQEFSQMALWRNTFATHWEETSELILPTSRNTFFYQNFNWPGQKKTDRQIDATGMMALHRFGAICDSLLTPRNLLWHGLEANNPYVMKDRASRLWFESTSRKLFKFRYSPYANFSANNQNNFQSLGAFGNAGMFIDELDGSALGGVVGLRYKAVPLGELFLKENHQGMIDGFCRWFRMTARQIYQRWPKTFPVELRAALESQNQGMIFNIIHRVCPRTDYDPDRIDYKGKYYTSDYISVEGRVVLSMGGYRTLPIAASRYDQTPGEVYGRGPAQMVLPALKTLNAEKVTFLTQGHRAAAPILLTSDDGLLDVSLRPGAVNKGGVTPDGKELVKVLPTGNIQITKEMMDEEKGLINDAFLVSLFQILEETPQMTATEVIERVNEKGILIAPTIGRQQSEYLGPMIDRELDILSYLGQLDPMPPRLREAKGEYSVVYTSPISRAAKAQESAGFLRTLESVKELVNITGDPSLLDPFEFDVAVPGMAEHNAVPESWMSSKLKIAQKRQQRAKNQAKQQQIQAMPAQAAMIKAQAVAAKAQPGAQPQQPQAQPQQPGLGGPNQ